MAERQANGGAAVEEAVEEAVEAVLAALSAEERAALTAGVDMWHGEALPAHGLRALTMTDGPAGTRGSRWVGTRGALAPCGAALGATWDPELVGEVGRVLGEQARSKSADVLLAPTVNLHRSPLAGRNFECFSEDPLLTARLAVAHVRGVQSAGVAACIKHFVANDSEFERHTISSEVDEGVLRELYLLPFEAAVRVAGVWSVMSAYNRLNGTYCAADPWLLREVLKGEWGFDGAVISDWWGAQGDDSVPGGLDLEMPGPAKYAGRGLAGRVDDGSLEASVLDDAARRVLRLLARTGGLDAPDGGPEREVDDPDHRAVLRRAAAASFVLLRNDPVDGAPLLPLDPGALRTVAVIGPNAGPTALLGGGSAALNPFRTDGILDGLRERLGDGVTIVHEPGVDATRTAHPIPARALHPGRGAAPGERGVTVDYFDNLELAGDPVRTDRHSDTRLIWIDDDALPAAGFSARVSATFTAEVGGDHTFTLVSADTGRLLLGGEVVVDNTADRRPGAAFFGLGSEEVSGTVDLAAGAQVELVAEVVGFEGVRAGALLVGHRPPLPGDALQRAVDAAAAADVAVVVVGLNADWETEGEDRSTMALPGGQDELVRAVRAANPRTVVLVNAGAPVELDATDDVAALGWIWYPGQEAAGAVADVLCGDVAPSGRLPTTLGRRAEDWSSWPHYPGADGVVRYGEGLLMGYRGFDAAGIEPAFCFGHGLTYTTFAWGTPTLAPLQVGAGALADELSGRAGATVEVRVPVANTGDRRGSEVVQVYVEAPSRPGRPPRELRGFARLDLDPGDAGVAVVVLDRRALARWDEAAADWVVDPGDHVVHLGRSSRDLPASVTLTVTP